MLRRRIFASRGSFAAATLPARYPAGRLRGGALPCPIASRHHLRGAMPDTVVVAQFDVDLSGVGCGCNAAFYLTQMPAGEPTRCGDYYCDANNVCGALCTEIDLMEANNHAFQATMHKCWNGGCDGGGCGANTRHDSSNPYGPGGQHKINTQSKFTVKTVFGASGGKLVNVTTILEQNGNSYMMRHDDGRCGGGYMEAIAGPLVSSNARNALLARHELTWQARVPSRTVAW